MVTSSTERMYKQLERGKWIQSFRYKDVDGKTRQKQVRGKTKKETDIAKNAFLSDLEKQKNETAINSSNPLFDDFISDFLLYKEGQLKRSTYTTYIYRINNHIIDYFSGKRIRDINIKMIDIYAHLFSQSEDDMIDIINKVLTKY